MTTTHMRLPEQFSAVGKTAEEAAWVMEQEGIVYYGSCAGNSGKMSFPGEEAYEALCRRADLILVEADGSRRLPMKVPDWPREPVIPLNVDAVMVVYGLSALGKPLREVCKRWELGIGWLAGDSCGEPYLVTESMAVDFLIKGYLNVLRFRFPNVQVITILNQAEPGIRRAAGLRMKELLEQRGWECRLTRLRTLKLAVVYMASGFGKRFGSNKLLEAFGFDGKPLFRHGLELFLRLKERMERDAGIPMRIILVSQYPEILEYGEKAGVRTVENPFAAEGITASIRLGTEAAAEEAADYYLYSVADQPWLQEETVWSFLTGFLDLSLTEQKSIGCLAAEGRRGNPVIFHRRYGDELTALKGDRGGSQIMKRYPQEVMEFPVDGRELADIDCRDDLRTC